MLELATIVREVGDDYRRRFGDRMPPSHARALSDIEHCRTAVLGGQLYRCDGCAREQYSYHSCQNRACPKCQQDRTDAWLQAQRERLLPCEHFLFTFTLPAPLRPIARSHQRVVYDALLRCAADAVLTLAADHKHLGARPAVLAVLHTHGRDLGYHPHAHLLVSAGGLSDDVERFIPSRHARFLLPARVLSVLFRHKMRDALEPERLTEQLPDQLWRTPWVVHGQHAGSGEQVLQYLGRYLFKSPLPNSRLERFEHGKVTFRFQSHRTGTTVHQTLPAEVFLQRLLQHVLPKRLHHVRGYGLLAPTSKQALLHAHELLQQVADRVEPAHADPQPTVEPTVTVARTHRCPYCHRAHTAVLTAIRQRSGSSACSHLSRRCAQPRGHRHEFASSRAQLAYLARSHARGAQLCSRRARARRNGPHASLTAMQHDRCAPSSLPCRLLPPASAHRSDLSQPPCRSLIPQAGWTRLRSTPPFVAATRDKKR